MPKLTSSPDGPSLSASCEGTVGQQVHCDPSNHQGRFVMSNHPIQLGLVEPGNQQDAVGCTVAFPGEHPSSLVGKPDTWSEHLLCPGDFEDTRELVGRAEKDHHLSNHKGQRILCCTAVTGNTITTDTNLKPTELTRYLFPYWSRGI
jgi:hypothetical protein